MLAGEKSQSVPFFVSDITSTVGAGLGSLVYNTSSLAAKYRRQGDSAWTTITLATMTLGTWASGGFVSDGGPVTGGYELGLPDAVLAAAAGVEWAEVAIYGAANMLAVLLFIEFDNRTICRGTVGTATTPSTTQFTPSALFPAGAAVDQFKGRIIVFDNNTATASLRGQATDITASSSDALSLLTFTEVPIAPASGDTFSIL